MIVLHMGNLKEAWRLNIIWAAHWSRLNLEVRRKPAYLRASGNRRGDISGWLIYLSVYFTINFRVKTSPWENWVGNKWSVVKGVWLINVPIALQFISGATTAKQAEESQLLVFGKKSLLKWKKKKKKVDFWMLCRWRRKTTVLVESPIIALNREVSLKVKVGPTSSAFDFRISLGEIKAWSLSQ